MAYNRQQQDVAEDLDSRINEWVESIEIELPNSSQLINASKIIRELYRLALHAQLVPGLVEALKQASETLWNYSVNDRAREIDKILAALPEDLRHD